MEGNKVISMLVVSLLFFTIFVGIISFENKFVDGVEATTYYVGGTGPGNHTKIQDAIDNASTGDIVRIYTGTYFEHILVNKTLTLIGNGSSSTIIDGGDASTNVVTISADWVNITGFWINNSGSAVTCAGIYINNVKNCHIYKNYFTFNNLGIHVQGDSDYNIFENNNFQENDWGIGLRSSNTNNNYLINNTIVNSTAFGFGLDNSHDNLISGNKINDSGNGIHFWINANNNFVEKNVLTNNTNGSFIFNAKWNILTNNEIENNDYGVYIGSGTGNLIYHNVFLSNNNHAFENGFNYWNASYPLGGNYWDNYTGIDTKYGPNQNLAGFDDIGDTKFTFSGSGDNYPFINITGWNRVLNQNTGLWYPTIQQAIDNSSSNNQIFVPNGAYYENVIVNKTLNITGEDHNYTILDAYGNDNGIYVTADWVNVTEFMIIRSAGWPKAAINLKLVKNCNVYNNNLWSNDVGVYLSDASYNNVSANDIKSSNSGIYLIDYTHDNEIFGNNIFGGSIGLYLLLNSYNNTLRNNNVSNCSDYGICFEGSNGNIVERNDIINGQEGVFFGVANNNLVSNNDIQSCTNNGIHFFLSSKKNIISNNKIWNHTNGITISTTNDNNTISDNIIYSNTKHGIHLESKVENITINGNTIYNHEDGIYFENFCENNNVSGNNISSCSRYGIYITSSSNNTFSKNNIYSLSNSGIYLHSFSKYNIIKNNNIGLFSISIYLLLNADKNTILNNYVNSSRDYGICLEGADGNDVIGNYVTNNNYGIVLGLAYNNKIFNNIISNQSNIGIYILGAGYNSIYHNNFINNSGHTSDDTKSNKWNLSYPIGGNYWDTWVKPDNNGDGFVDNPYIIGGSASNQDKWPVAKENGWENIKPALVYNLDSGKNFTSIQAAIDDQNTINGHRLFAESRTYHEKIIINKSVTLMGEDKNDTIINGSGTGDVVYITSNWINFTGFTVRNGGNVMGDAGIEINGAQNCKIQNNNISSHGWHGIYLVASNSSIISGNDVNYNGNTGIYLDSSMRNEINGNNINSNVQFGIYLISVSCNNNSIIENNINSNNEFGICLEGNGGHKIYGNNISNQIYGLAAFFSSNSIISKNNINSHTQQGLYLLSGSNNTIKNNVFNNNKHGISLDSSSNYNEIINNEVNSNTNYGISTATSIYNISILDNKIYNNSAGIYLPGSNHNITIKRNNIISNFNYGINLISSSYISISENIFLSNNEGIHLDSSCNNLMIYHNSFLKNSVHAYDDGTNNWNLPYPGGGNYWDDYKGLDNLSGLNQDIPGSDKLGDTPYSNINGSSGAMDNYPLMNHYGTSNGSILITSHRNFEYVSGIIIIETAVTFGDLSGINFYINDDLMSFDSSFPYQYIFDTATLAEDSIIKLKAEAVLNLNPNINTSVFLIINNQIDKGNYISINTLKSNYQPDQAISTIITMQAPPPFNSIDLIVNCTDPLGNKIYTSKNSLPFDLGYQIVLKLPSDATLGTYTVVARAFGYINESLHWTASDSTTFSVSGSSLHSHLWYQNQTLDNLVIQINDIRSRVLTIDTNLTNVETAILNRLNNLESDFMNELAAVNLTLYNELQDVLDELSNLDINVSSDPTFRPWLEGILGALNNDLAYLNVSINKKLDDLDTSTSQFYSELKNELTVIKAQMTFEHNLLNNTINSLETLDISEIHSRLTSISNDLAINHKNLSVEISKLNNKIDVYQNDIDTKLSAIDQDLDELDKLDDIISILETLDELLGDTEKELIKEIKETKTETDSGGADINTVLLVIILVILIIMLLMNFLGKKPETTPKVEPEDESVKSSMPIISRRPPVKKKK